MTPAQLKSCFLNADNRGRVDLSGKDFTEADLITVLRNLPPLPNLQELDLSDTQVGDKGVIALAASSGLTNLQLLNLSRTQVGDEGLKALALAATSGGGGFPNLQWLYLSGTQVGDEGLKALALAATSGGFPKLQRLSLHDTQVKSVLPEVLATGDAKQIFNAVLKGVAFHHVRIAFLGMGGVGKTWLFRRLFLDQLVDPGEQRIQTPDIDLVRPEQVNWKPIVHFNRDHTDTGITVQPHVWDFGGQLVLHGVHESFLTPDERTLCILVLAADRAPQRATDDNGDESGNRLDYWLRTIAGFAGPQAPLVIAVTRSDIYKPGDPRKIDQPRPVGDWTPDDLSDRTGGPAVASIVDNCSACDENLSVKPLRDAVEAALAQLTAIREQKVAPELIDLMDRVKSEMSRRKLATLDQFRQWCALANITDPDAQDANLRVLHYLGFLFYFAPTPYEQKGYADEKQRDPDHWRDHYPNGYRRHLTAEPADSKLVDNVINPVWLKRPLYGVIRRSERQPRMTPADIADAIHSGEDELARLYDHAFDPHSHSDDVIFAFLKHIELCHHDEKEGEYVFPHGFLTPHPLHAWATPDSEGYDQALHCSLRWPVLRDGAFHRLVVHWYADIAPIDGQQRWCWSRGMVVNKYNAQAALIANPDDGTIQIHLHGGQPINRRDLLHDLHRDLVHYTGQPPANQKEFDDLLASLVPPPAPKKSRRQPPKDGRLLHNVNLLKKELLECIKDAHSAIQHETEFPPQPLKTELAQRIGVKDWEVSRCIKKPEVNILYRALRDETTFRQWQAQRRQ